MRDLVSTKERWVSATENLNKRRGPVDPNKEYSSSITPVSNYLLHIAKCGVGDSLLDVGCGTQFLKHQLPRRVEYIGIDAFPLSKEIEKLAIEDDEVLKYSVDTVCAFAVLDNCMNFHKAISNMKKIAKKNIIILTGIGIDPDKYHTLRLELEDFDEAFADWESTHRELISNKVYLLNYAPKS